MSQEEEEEREPDDGFETQSELKGIWDIRDIPDSLGLPSKAPRRWYGAGLGCFWVLIILWALASVVYLIIDFLTR